jgi:type I restriction enzyme S subunit
MYGANEAADDATLENPRFVRITDIMENGGLRDDTFRSLPRNVAEPYLLRDGDILLARSGATVGKSFIYKNHWGVCCFAGYLIRVRVKQERALPDFIWNAFQASFYWQYVMAAQIQATIQNFSAEKYAEFRLCIPPLSEQHGI